MESSTKYTIEQIGIGNSVKEIILFEENKKYVITDTGVIIVRNLKTEQIITMIIARPNQLKRLYGKIGETPPRKLLRLAYIHTIQGLHN